MLLKQLYHVINFKLKTFYHIDYLKNFNNQALVDIIYLRKFKKKKT